MSAKALIEYEHSVDMQNTPIKTAQGLDPSIGLLDGMQLGFFLNQSEALILIVSLPTFIEIASYSPSTTGN